MKSSNKILLGVLISILALAIFPMVFVKMNLKEMVGTPVKGNGQITRQDQTVADFKGIHSMGNFEVFLQQGPKKLSLEGESNLLDLVEIRVEGGELMMQLKPGISISNQSEIKVFLSTPVIETVELSGAGSVQAESTLQATDLMVAVSGAGHISLQLEATNVVANLSGAGNIELRGKAEKLEATLSGVGNIAAENLESQNVKATCSGAGNLQVYPIQQLDADASGVGSISYKGEPKNIQIRESTTGKVVKM